MHKLIFAAVLAVVLVACKQPAPEASAPAPPAVDSTASVPPTTDTPPPQIAVDDHQAVNASIDSVLGDHEKYESVINVYQKAIAEGDAVAVAELVDYPFETTLDGKEVAIKDRADFIGNYDRIVTPAIARVIKAQKYSELMVNGRGVMFGSGETWINGVCKPGSADCSEFEVKVVAIQPGG